MDLVFMNYIKALKHESILFKLNNNNNCWFDILIENNRVTLWEKDSSENTWQRLINKIHQIYDLNIT